MAQAQSTTFAKFKILVGDGADPEVFSLICGLTSKGIDWSTSTQTTEAPDCADEDLPSWQEIGITSVGAAISGDGLWSAQSHGLLLNWIADGESKNVQIRYDDAAGGDPLYAQGPAVCTSLSDKVQKGQKLTRSVAFAFTQKPILTNA